MAPIAGLQNISFPSGPKSATASSRLSTTDSKSVGEESALARDSESCALTASNELPRSLNSAPSGRSRRTSSSPRPRRVRPLWITWIGCSIHCASSIATIVDISSASATPCIAVLNACRSSSFTSSVEMPIRIEPNFCSPKRSGCRLSNVRSEYTVRRRATALRSRIVDSSSCSGIGLPSSDGKLCATATPSRFTIAA